jgi:hypothetical protein
MLHQLFMWSLVYVGIAIFATTIFAFLMECFGKEGPMEFAGWLLGCIYGLVVWPFYLLLALLLIFDFFPNRVHPRRRLRNCLPFRSLWIA